MKITETKVKTALRRHGYKLTRQRRSVIKAVISSDNRLTPAALYHKLHQDYPDIGLVTVYRTLGTLVATVIPALSALRSATIT